MWGPNKTLLHHNTVATSKKQDSASKWQGQAHVTRIRSGRKRSWPISRFYTSIRLEKRRITTTIQVWVTGNQTDILAGYRPNRRPSFTLLWPVDVQSEAIPALRVLIILRPAIYNKVYNSLISASWKVGGGGGYKGPKWTPLDNFRAHPPMPNLREIHCAAMGRQKWSSPHAFNLYRRICPVMLTTSVSVRYSVLPKQVEVGEIPGETEAGAILWRYFMHINLQFTSFINMY